MYDDTCSRNIHNTCSCFIVFSDICLLYLPCIRRKFRYKLLFQFVKPGFKNIYIKLILFILFTAAAAAVCILIYITAGLTGIDKIGEIAKDFYLIDVITNTFVGYFVIVTWYFAFPYSLINSYIKNIRPLIRKDKNNDTND